MSASRGRLHQLLSFSDTYGQAERQTDRQMAYSTDRKTDRQLANNDRQTDGIYGQTERWHILTDRWHNDRQTDDIY